MTIWIFREANAENNALFSAAGGVLYPPGVLLSLAAKAQEQGSFQFENIYQFYILKQLIDI